MKYLAIALAGIIAAILYMLNEKWQRRWKDKHSFSNTDISSTINQPSNNVHTGKMKERGLNIPKEIHYKNKSLVISLWKLQFAFEVNGIFYPFNGHITDVSVDNNKSFDICCKDDGYVNYITLYHSNGKQASFIMYGTYLQSPGDLDNGRGSSVKCYDEFGNTISPDEFDKKYPNINKTLDKCLAEIPKRNFSAVQSNS